MTPFQAHEMTDRSPCFGSAAAALVAAAELEYVGDRLAALDRGAFVPVRSAAEIAADIGGAESCIGRVDAMMIAAGCQPTSIAERVAALVQDGICVPGLTAETLAAAANGDRLAAAELERYGFRFGVARAAVA